MTTILSYRLRQLVITCLLSLCFIVITAACHSQSCANYAVARNTAITYSTISGTGNVVAYWRGQTANQNDDNRSIPVPIGFDFWYLGVRYTAVNICINGYIDFSTTSYDGNWPLGDPSPQPPGYAACSGYIAYREDGRSFYNVPCGNGNPPNSYDGTYWALAPMYCDLWCSNGATPLANSIKYLTSGTAPSRVFTAEYINMDDWASASTSNYNFQVKIFESTGVIQFVYGSMAPAPGAPTPYSCGINGRIKTNPAAAADLLSQRNDNTATFSNINPRRHTAAPTSNSRITFTPPVPANTAAAITFTNIGNTSMTLNWPNWATNENGYVIYISTDGINYTFYTQTAANATSYAATGLYGSTYWWKVYAVTEGCLSTPCSGSQATLVAGRFISIKTGNWNDPTVWDAGVVPSNGDSVIIDDGDTVTINGSYGCTHLTVGRGTSGLLLIGNSTTARTISILGDIRINTGGSFIANTSFAAVHTMAISGNLVNNGTFDMRPNATSLCNLTFNRNGNQTISGSGAVNSYNNMALSMGSSVSNILEVTADNFSAPSNFLTMNNGTFKFSVPVNAVTLNVFTTATTIPYTCGLWMNSPNSTMYAHSTLYFQGDLTCDAGVINIGDNADETLMSNGAFLKLTGGVISVAGRLDRPSYVAVTNVMITGGTLNLNTIGSTSTTSAPFMIDVVGSSFYMTGGKIIIRRAGANNLGYYNINCSSYTFSGGTLQFGNGSTPVGPPMEIYTDHSIANLSVQSTNNPIARMASTLNVTGNIDVRINGTLNCNSLDLAIGGNLINEGTVTTGNNTVTFNGAAAQQVTGKYNSLSLYNLNINNTSGDVTLNNSADVTVNGTLGFTDGKIILDTANLIIASGNAVTGYNDSSFVVTRGTATNGSYLGISGISASRDFPIGSSVTSYSPVRSFVNAGTADRFNARVFDGVLQYAVTGNVITDAVVNKTWLINESVPGGSNVYFRLEWNSSEELSGFSRSSSGISVYDTVNAAWDTPSSWNAASPNPSPYYNIMRNGISSFPAFMVKSGITPLPVELLNFSAILNNQHQTSLTWETASELNNDYFDIGRSTDNIHFKTVARVKGAGNSSTPVKYHILDYFPETGINYYRLGQVDFNSQVKWSPVKSVLVETNQPAAVSVTMKDNRNLQLRFNYTPSGAATIVIYDSLGKETSTRIVHSIENGDEVPVDCSRLSKGIYYVLVTDHILSFQSRFLKE